MKRIFSILGNKNKGRSVFNISSRGIHRERKSYDDVGTVLGKETFVRKFYALNKARKVLFVRDPYEKLFSGYVDRVFGVTENLRQLLQIIFPPKGNSTKKADCRLTFQDVVVYVTSRKTMQVDQHFRPAYT
ncbi:uncharacterized protein [Littorina saxatilis]|uniref:uncharacterized protein n=1 Tax=Littorina saxatilis TaxID=31220 RepID=UPI0038B5A64C